MIDFPYLTVYTKLKRDDNKVGTETKNPFPLVGMET